MITVQEVKFSQETIYTEIRTYQEFIDEWEQDLSQVQEKIRECKSRISLLNELIQHVTHGSRTSIVQANINMAGDELEELTIKEIKLNGNIKAYQEFVTELNKML